MNYFRFHIGDFDRATRHLTRIERSVYRDLLDVYYDTEKELVLDTSVLCRKIIARTDEEVTAVAQVLTEFFVKTSTGWLHNRCEIELDQYRSSTTQKSIAGRASAANRANKKQQAFNEDPTNVEQTLNERATTDQQTCNVLPTNQEPTTSNQEPESKKEKKEAASTISRKRPAFDPLSVALPDFLPADLWADWAKFQREKGKALTETSVKLQLRKLTTLRDAGHDPVEVIENSICNGWQGFFPPKKVVGVQPKRSGVYDKKPDNWSNEEWLAFQECQDARN
jgi:uncharacterized protein YdaU (DUF1376 family)